MAATTFGSSPRHQGRVSNSHCNTSGKQHYMTANSLSTSVSHHQQQNTSLDFPRHAVPTHSNNLLLPPASYLSAGTPISSSTFQPQSFPFVYSSVQQETFAHYHHSSSTTLMYVGGQRPQNKRKSAVEMLAESKPLYVKSETLLDRHQKLSCRNGISSKSGERSSKITGVVFDVSTNAQCISSPSKSGPNRPHRSTNRRSASSSSDLLQTKLRKLLNAEAKDSSQKYDTFSKYQNVKYSQELSVNPSADQNDASVMLPSAFLSPQSLPPHPSDDFYSFGMGDALFLTDNYRAISPPAEYAADSSPENTLNKRSSYKRSYSHSHDATSDGQQYSSTAYNINSHKSLPDLHSQISRHSPHSEALSFCSRGNRSNKSGGSSLNRDSGGSSGHYTHRSEPCCKEKESVNMSKAADFRRDSGSSTQHSGNSYYTSSSRYIDCPECRAKYQQESECLLNFTTPEVPEAFQDDYPDPNKSNRYHDATAQLPATTTQTYSQRHQSSPTTKIGEFVPNQGNVIREQELSPPLGTFKRQKCLRFKHRNRYSSSNEPHLFHDDQDDYRKPILRSKSDISDRYWSRAEPAKMYVGIEKRGRAESMSQLEDFFDRLGLNDDKFEEIYTPKRRHSDNESEQSSTVFFSDVSTVDSTRLPDSTETNASSETYRPTEPPSIVERNARIIKWLCNCRKSQLV